MAYNGKLPMETASDWYKVCRDNCHSVFFWKFYLRDEVEVCKQPGPQHTVQSDNKSCVTKVCSF